MNKHILRKRAPASFAARTASAASGTLAALAAAAMLASTPAMAAGPALVDFDDGMQGWQPISAAVGGYSAIDRMLGDGSLAFHGSSPGFGYGLVNSANAAFTGDYTAMKSMTISLDMTVAELATFQGGMPLQRELILELRDYDKPGGMYGFSSVWISLGVVGAGQPARQHFSVTIGDTSSLTLPGGWHGAGAIDAEGNMGLPAGQTFQRILQDVDEISISTFMPGYFYATSYFDASVDNIRISAVPEPSQWGMMAAGLGLLGLTARRRREPRLG